MCEKGANQRPNRGVVRHTNEDCMKLTVRPLTPDLWPALEDLFGKSGKLLSYEA
jgi:hypothetical protein